LSSFVHNVMQERTFLAAGAATCLVKGLC
jgi:hypothetical protein